MQGPTSAQQICVNLKSKGGPYTLAHAVHNNLTMLEFPFDVLHLVTLS